MDNTLVWADIPTRDLDRAMAFYSALLDAGHADTGGDPLRHAAPRWQQRGGLSRPHGQVPPAGAHGPLIYLALGERLQEAEQLVPKIGGRVLEPLHSIGSGHGCRVIIEDTEGNWLALYAPPAS